MRNILVVAVVAVLLVAAPALAQQTTGRISGTVTAAGTKAAVSGATVIAIGPQGEEATLTDDNGEYLIDSLTIGSYVVRVFPPGASNATEKVGVAVSAGATVRVNVVTGEAAAAPSEVVVVRRRAPIVDLGTTRTGLSLTSVELTELPIGRNFGDALQLSPGVFVDSSGNVSINGASGLENTYVLDGLNVTGVEFGDIMSTRRNSSGGTNLPLEFIQELQVLSGGYSPEYGGAMGGLVNVITKSGSNEFHGSVFTLATPSFLIGDPRIPPNSGSVLTGNHVEGNDINVGFEVGGPIIRNKLFFWAGFAPRFESGHYERQVLGRIDADGDGVADVDAHGDPSTRLLSTSTADEYRRSYSYGAKVTYLVAPEHRLDVSLLGSPTNTRSIYRDPITGLEPSGDLRSLTNQFDKNNTDAIATWTSNLFDRHWKLEGSAGLHNETFTNQSPYSDLNSRQQLEWHNTSLAVLEPTVAGCQHPAGGFDPCPVDNYKGGGFGLYKHFTANREMLELKSTNVFDLGGRHELKYGARLELSQFDLSRHYTGPLGQRNLVQVYPDNTIQWSMFTLPQGAYPYQFAMDPSVLGGAPYYQDQLLANVKSDSEAAFVQDTYSPLPNLTLTLGVRYERQNLYDYHGDRFAQLDNWGPRIGAIYDPTNDGRAKLFAHYGRFYESVPMNLAARYFGGEGILTRQYTTAGCTPSPYQWKGTGNELAGCMPPTGAAFYNNGSLYPVQPRLRGQYHDEVVAGAEHQIHEDLLAGVSFTHRWLGSVLEDGTAAPDFTFVLANPGNIPDAALKDVQAQIDAKQKQIDAATTEAEKTLRTTELGALQSKLDNLKGLAAEPKPERTYTALTLHASTRVTKRMSLHASYTYSRLIGNYNGLYDADNNYAAPNGNNAYDTPELVVNRRGPLANDRPHSARFTGFYELPVSSNGSVVFGSVFSVFSGVPRNYIGALIPGQQLVFLLPRGSAGRTPTITQIDGRVAYRAGLPGNTSLELFVEVFNILNTRTATLLDNNYTYDMVAPIKDGTTADLPYARNIGGQPVSVNPNFGKPIAYQAPIHGRLGLRLLF